MVGTFPFPFSANHLTGCKRNGGKRKRKRKNYNSKREDIEEEPFHRECFYVTGTRGLFHLLPFGLEDPDGHQTAAAMRLEIIDSSCSLIVGTLAVSRSMV